MIKVFTFLSLLCFTRVHSADNGVASKNDAYECPPYNGYGLVDGVGMQDNNELDLPYEFPKAFRNIPEKKDSRLPRFFWARRKMFAKFREMILKNLAIAQNRKRDEKQKRYNPMFYPSYQAEDVDKLLRNIMGKSRSSKEQEGLLKLKELSKKLQGPENYLNMVSDEYSLGLQLTNQIGFKVLPNREVCIAGLKLAGQLMPTKPQHKLAFLMKMGRWLSTEMKDCFPNQNGWQMMTRKECTAKLIATVTSYNFRKIWEIVRQQNLFTEAEEQAMYRSTSNDY